MIKEMFVSSTPHETKVAVTEDDQLAEIFYERENEYTLAGSIYKGRVTRVLPGMQSAFVDIGLERDAFLYVSDFLELGSMEEEEELDEIPIPPTAYVSSQPQQEPKHFDFLKSPSPVQQEIESIEEDFGDEGEEGSEDSAESGDGSQEQGRDFRDGGRRRRRGRRGRGFPENKFARPGYEQKQGQEQGRGYEQRHDRPTGFEPRPPAFEPHHEHRPHEAEEASRGESGFEPMVLPGESISKYRRGQGEAHAPQQQGHAFGDERGHDRGHTSQREQESIATVADVPPEHTHEPVPIIEDALPQEEPHHHHRSPVVTPFVDAAPTLLPGESLRKYRREGEVETAVAAPSEPAHMAPKPEVAKHEGPKSPAVTSSSYRPVTLVENFNATSADSPFTLPGESLRKYQKTEHSQPDSPVSHHVEEAAPPVVAEAEAVERGGHVEAPAATAPRPVDIRESVTPVDGPVSVLPVMVPTETTSAPVAEPALPSEAPVAATPAAEHAVAEHAVAEHPTAHEEKKEEKEVTEASVRMDPRSQVASFVLPGETLKKYSRRRKKAAPVEAEVVAEPEAALPASEAVTAPTSNLLDKSTEGGTDAVDTLSASAEAKPVEQLSEPERDERMNVASTFAGEQAEHDTVPTAAERGVEAEATATYTHSGFGEGFGQRREFSAQAEEPTRDHHEPSPLASLPTETAETELADARPQFTQDEMTMEEFEEASRHRRERLFEPTPAGTMEHEEIESDDLPDDEHDFREVRAIGSEEDAIFEELEETTLAPQAAEALNDERAEEPFVIEGGYEFEHAEHGAGMEAADEDVVEEDVEEEEGEEEEHGTAQTGTPAYPQRRPPFDRRRGRRGGRRGNFPGQGGSSGRPPRRDAQRQNIQISDLLKEGQEVLIQIAKEPIGKKGARITSHIALPGRFLVYMPTVNHIGVSRKINSEEERQRLKRIMISEREGGHGGFIVRTAAAGITEEELRADIRFLKNLWSEIRTRADDSNPPALIYHDLNLVERVLRDQVTSDFATIWVDTESEYERILRFANRFQPSLVRKVKLYTKETPLYEQFGIQDEINKGLRSKVWLKSGGYIVINQTEALVAIDINTGKYVGKTTRLEDTIVKTNIDAIKEIVRQIRLRDLGGIIVIDFIDMDERKNRQKVMQALEEALKADRAPSKVLQFNDFGLVAITRKRVKQSLERTLGQPCPYCTGNGFVKSITTVCNEIYVEARKLARHLDKDSVILRVNPEVGKALKANSAKMVNEIEELTGRTIIVKSDPQVHTEQFDFN